MKKTRALFLIVGLIGLSSCTSEDTGTQVDLFLPDSLRQTLQFDRANLIVHISVNGGLNQIFPFDNGLSTMQVSVSGIQREQQNEISIVWIEVVDGRNVEISQQQQEFFADGNTTVDAPHVYWMFDYDRDEVTNYQERLSGTCVWPEEQCIGNILLNGDFSEGRDNWFVRGDDPYFLEGEYCLTASSDATISYESQIGYEPGVQLDGGLMYEFSFNIKADRASSVVAVVGSDTSSIIYNEVVNVSSAYERRSVVFSAFRDWTDARLRINIGDNPSVRYCFDDISLAVLPGI